LEVHHGQYRSQQGSDSEENLITLCTHCHKLIHSRHRGVGAANRQERTRPGGLIALVWIDVSGT
jgi:predicted HNH restriction endonuclease